MPTRLVSRHLLVAGKNGWLDATLFDMSAPFLFPTSILQFYVKPIALPYQKWWYQHPQWSSSIGVQDSEYGALSTNSLSNAEGSTSLSRKPCMLYVESEKAYRGHST